ncbi:hypothetical protein [Microvirga splendida]|uniref:Uncharacterized protein n=1 Tax=Microvirga splendida TaxID=2795727 RepID=A0ABS0Y5F8_9HYPH|nr:hypothetical protein [Microvirga splendida]MBJ6127517.1 hypothetical protein [Microvirga splendida]
MADEIRTLIADLYDDPEGFLKTPHRWFGSRSPDELIAMEAGQFVLLKFLHGGDHMPPIGPDRDFKPYTAANIDHAIDQAIARLESPIEQLRSLKGSGPEIATVIGRAREVYGDEGLLWLLEYSAEGPNGPSSSRARSKRRSPMQSRNIKKQEILCTSRTMRVARV